MRGDEERKRSSGTADSSLGDRDAQRLWEVALGSAMASLSAASSGQEVQPQVQTLLGMCDVLGTEGHQLQQSASDSRMNAEKALEQKPVDMGEAASDVNVQSLSSEGS